MEPGVSFHRAHNQFLNHASIMRNYIPTKATGIRWNARHGSIPVFTATQSLQSFPTPGRSVVPRLRLRELICYALKDNGYRSVRVAMANSHRSLYTAISLFVYIPSSAKQREQSNADYALESLQDIRAMEIILWRSYYAGPNGRSMEWRSVPGLEEKRSYQIPSHPRQHPTDRLWNGEKIIVALLSSCAVIRARIC